MDIIELDGIPAHRIRIIDNNVNCCVAGCRNYENESDLSFFKLPNDEERRNLWLTLIGRNDLRNRTDFSTYRVCSKHFTKSSIGEWFARFLEPHAVPTKFLPPGVRVHIMGYDYEDDVSSVATQTELTFRSEVGKGLLEVGKYNDVLDVPYYILYERDARRARLGLCTSEAAKRQACEEQGEENQKMKF